MKEEKKAFSIQMICGTPFNGYADETAMIKDIIENELKRWPTKEEYRTIAIRVGDRPSRVRMLVSLLKQQMRFFKNRQNMFPKDDREGY